MVKMNVFSRTVSYLILGVLFSAALLLAACNGSQPLSPTAQAGTAASAAVISTSSTLPPTSTLPQISTGVATHPLSPAEPVVDEAILILQPASGSRLTSPIVLQGEADTTFEQTLGVQLRLPDGTVVTQTNAQIDAELGQRGNFSVEIPFQVSGEQQAFLQVFSSSPRDGGILHLSSSGVVLLESGTAEIRQAVSSSEQISILEPVVGGRVSGGVAHISGWGWASFEQTLLVELLDADGNVLGSIPVTVASAEPGQPGPFQADISYTVASEMPGRVSVRDVSPAFGGDTHRASVEITIAP